MPRQQIREIMDELNNLGGMTPAHMVLITELVAVCLAAGPKPHVTPTLQNVTPQTGAERTRACRARKKALQEGNVTSLQNAVNNNIYNPSIQEGESEGKPKRRSVTEGTRLPDDWNPSETLWTWGKEKLSPDVLRFETAAFKDYWAAKPGSAGKKLDWDKTWRGWIREAVRRRDRFKPKIVEHQVTGPKRSWAEIKAEKEKSG